MEPISSIITRKIYRDAQAKQAAEAEIAEAMLQEMREKYPEALLSESATTAPKPTTQPLERLFRWRDRSLQWEDTSIAEIKRGLMEHGNFPLSALGGTWEADEKLKIVRDFAAKVFFEPKSSQRKGLYIHGTFGMGKTTLLGLIAVELENWLITCPKYITCGEYLALYSTFQHEEVEKFKKASLLFLDDFGAEYIGDSEFRMTGLFELLKYRYAYMLPTFIGSNLTPEDIAERGKTLTVYKQMDSLLDDDKYCGIFNYGHDISQTKRKRQRDIAAT